MATTTQRKHLLVLGGGFAGVQAAIAAAKTGVFAVTMVSDRDYIYLFPISIWIPTRTIAPGKTRVPLAQISKSHRFDVRVGQVERIDAAASTVIVDGEELSYDYAVLAIGAGKARPKGHEHIVSICHGPEAALTLRDQIDDLIAKGGGSIAVGFGGNPKDSSAVRGGPAFEMLFNIDHMLRRKGIRDKFSLTFFAPMDKPGNRMGTKAVAMLPSRFAKLGIASQTGVKITEFDREGILFEDGTRIQSDITMFIPAGVGNPIAAESGLPMNEAGFLRIDENCLVEGTDNLYAVGDAAAIEGPDWRAKLGHLAEAMGRIAIKNLTNASTGSAERESYVPHISIVCVMDTGNGANYVVRTMKHEYAIPLPIVGNWLKRGWGWHARVTKAYRVPRLPGL